MNLDSKVAEQIKDFVIHIQNILPKDFDVIQDGLENHVMATWDNMEKFKSLVWKNKKKEEKVEKGKFLGTYNKQYKQQYRKCGNYGHKPGDKKCPENKYEKE